MQSVLRVKVSPKFSSLGMSTFIGDIKNAGVPIFYFFTSDQLTIINIGHKFLTITSTHLVISVITIKFVLPRKFTGI